MITSAVQIVRFIFTQVWRLFNSWYVPGTNVTPAGFLFLVLFLTLVLKFGKRLFGLRHKEDDD